MLAALSFVVVMLGCDKKEEENRIGNIEISDGEWVEDITDGTTDIDPDKTLELYDIEGNKYGYIIIDDLFWMTSNLITTQFNDGTPIVEGKEVNDFMGDDDARYCYYENRPETKIQRGVLYNWLSVRTGKLCPKGWNVPSNEQWLAMREFLGGEQGSGGVLKAISGWLDRDGVSKVTFQGTNSIGFNAQPSGYRNQQGSFDNYAAGYGPESFVGWWSSTHQGSGLAEVANRAYRYHILYAAPNLVENYDPIYYGYPVRCVRPI